MISFIFKQSSRPRKYNIDSSNFFIDRNLTYDFYLDFFFFQLTHGASLAPEPHLLEPPFDVDAGEIVNSLLLASHLLGISVNALLCK